MKLSLKLLDSKLKAEEVGNEQADAIIKGFFDVLGRPKTIDVTNSITNVQPQEKIKPIKEAATPQNSLKKLPKIDDNRSLHTSIGELLDTSTTPLNIKTLDNGTTLYKTEYWCACGHEGKRFIRETNNYVKCHSCDTKLTVEDATLEVNENNIPLPDVNGNYFIARELYEPEGFGWIEPTDTPKQ